MKYCLIFLLLLSFSTAFSQDLEEAIYVATENFNANRTAESFSTLLKKETDFRPKIKTIDEQLAYFFLLINKGHYLDNINKQPQAILAYQTAWNIYNKHQLSTITDYDVIDYCLKPLGILYNKVGDYTNAENTIKQYIFIAEKNKNNSQRIAGAINLAQLYFTAGKFDEAIKVSENGLQIAGLTSSKKEKLLAIKNNSQIALNNSETTTIKTKNPEVKYNLALKSKDYKQALLHLREMITEEYSKPEFSARAIAKLHVLNAQLHLNLDHKNACALELKNALNVLLPNHDANILPKYEDLYAENTFIDIFDLLGNIQISSINALDCYDRSFYVSNLLTENITSQEAKLRHADKNRKRSEACIAILYQDFKTLKTPNIIVKALAYAEKNKASILKETIAKKSLLQLHPKDTLLLREQVLLTKQADLTNQLIKAEFEKKSETVNDLSYKLSKISNDLKVLKNKIDLSYPNDKNENFIDHLKRKLKKEKASLVEYFYGENDIYTFIISDKSLQFFKIKRDKSFDASISNYIDYFNSPNAINNDVPQYTTDAFKMYQQLKLNRVKASNNIIIIPDGFLNFIPFESLLSKETKTTNYSKMPFLIKKQCIVYNTSAEIFLKGKQPEFDDHVLGIFPVFKNTKKALTFSEDEAKSIDQFTDAKFLMYTSATKKDAFTQADNYGILHFSTHADAGSFTVPANIEFADDNLYLNELYTKQLDNNLVVLSACETGIGKLNKGEGSMSLARGFQYAGIDQLVFSLWKVNDKSTSQIMHNFYKNYNKFESAAIANQKSKQQYLDDKSITNAKKSPYYWSAFVYYGTTTIKGKSSILIYLLFTFIGLAITLLLWSVIRKQKHGRQA